MFLNVVYINIQIVLIIVAVVILLLITYMLQLLSGYSMSTNRFYFESPNRK